MPRRVWPRRPAGPSRCARPWCVRGSHAPRANGARCLSASGLWAFPRTAPERARPMRLQRKDNVMLDNHLISDEFLAELASVVRPYIRNRGERLRERWDTLHDACEAGAFDMARLNKALTYSQIDDVMRLVFAMAAIEKDARSST